MRFGAVVGGSLLLSVLAACTMPGPPAFALTGDATGSSVALTGNTARSAVGSTGGAAAGADIRYSLQVVDFDRTRFESAADCFTAASARGLPLIICQGGL